MIAAAAVPEKRETMILLGVRTARHRIAARALRAKRRKVRNDLRCASAAVAKVKLDDPVFLARSRSSRRGSVGAGEPRSVGAAPAGPRRANRGSGARGSLAAVRE